MTTTEKTIALIGNPNTGKTSLFNNLTGAKQKVGNWPGVTIEKKEGPLINHPHVTIIDLPGIYSMGSQSEDELVARNYLLLEKPHAVINVLDATNLQRNLYLTVQLLEMGVPVIVALNMMDEIENAIKINVTKLSYLLKVPIVPTIARTKMGLGDLVRVATAEQAPPEHGFSLDYGPEIEAEIRTLEEAILTMGLTPSSYPLRFLALKLLEEGENFLKTMQMKAELCEKIFHNLLAFRKQSMNRLKKIYGENLAAMFIEKRYQYINTVLQQVVDSPDLAGTYTLSDKIDRIVLNKYIGLPLFFLAILVVFKITFTLSSPLVSLLEIFCFPGKSIVWADYPRFTGFFVVEGIIGGLEALLFSCR